MDVTRTANLPEATRRLAPHAGYREFIQRTILREHLPCQATNTVRKDIYENVQPGG